MGYEALLRMAVWGEHPDTAQRRIDDWVDHLEEFRQGRSRAAFARELVLGAIAHTWARASDPSSGSTAVPVLALGAGALTSVAIGFVGKPGVSFSVAADTHFTLGVAALLVSLARVPHDTTASRLRISAFLVAGSGLWHALAVISDVTVQPLMSLYLGVGGLGLILTAMSARQSGIVLGRSRVAKGVLFVGFLLGALAHVHLALVGSFTLPGALAGLAGLELVFVGYGFWRLWSSTQSLWLTPGEGPVLSEL